MTDRPEYWRVDYDEDAHGRSPFAKWFQKKLTPYEQAVLTAAIEQVLRVLGTDICESEWGKPLGQGLYEFRVRRSLHAIRTGGLPNTPPAPPGQDRTVLPRVFLTFHGKRIVLLLHGLNKGRDPSPRRQQSEIKRARRILEDWKRQHE